MLHRLEGAVDDAGVVAEEETTEGGDDGDQAKTLRVGTRMVRRKGGMLGDGSAMAHGVFLSMWV
ncbi:MAG: hypothetical protein ACRDSJ_13710 [Rubrobacteraceae bacterium]